MVQVADPRPGVHEYFMGIAQAVRARANCMGRKVGAVIVLDGRIVSTGYNGTPEGMTNCLEGGCVRCSQREKFESGTAYDVCICVHAEQNALLAAARFGIAVQGATAYTTMQPCFGCAKEMLQAKIHSVYYLDAWNYPDEQMAEQYQRILSEFPGGVHPLTLADATASVGAVVPPAPTPMSDETGHAAPDAM